MTKKKQMSDIFMFGTGAVLLPGATLTGSIPAILVCGVLFIASCIYSGLVHGYERQILIGKLLALSAMACVTILYFPLGIIIPASLKFATALATLGLATQVLCQTN